MKPLTLYDLNLILQLIILAIFLTAIYHIKKSRKSLTLHRLLMGIIVILNTVLVFLIMGRSFFTNINVLTRRPYEFGPLVTWIHVLLGGAAMVLGASFFRRHSGNVRLKMRVAASLWATALLSGILFYVYYYLL